MARTRDAHPLGKVSQFERLELHIAPELKQRLNIIAGLHGKSATALARDALEKWIEGEWAFIQRRVAGPKVPGQQEEKPEENPDA